MELLGGIEGLASVELGEEDVARHRLVRNIVRAYGRNGPPPAPAAPVGPAGPVGTGG
jgi:phosphate starvation-inducible protein PhoH